MFCKKLPKTCFSEKALVGNLNFIVGVFPVSFADLIVNAGILLKIKVKLSDNYFQIRSNVYQMVNVGFIFPQLSVYLSLYPGSHFIPYAHSLKPQ